MEDHLQPSLRVVPKVPALLHGCPFIGTSKIAEASRLRIGRVTTSSFFQSLIFCAVTRACSRYLRASTMSAKLRKPMKSTSSFSNREKILRKPLSLRNSLSISLRFL
jgi:hypothetical protein